MKRILLAIVLAILFCLLAKSLFADEIYPDSNMTPGATFNVTKEQVCTLGYSKSVRHVTKKLKRKVYHEYHMSRIPSKCCEIDHFIPLELGGSNDIKNLWPETFPTAYWKDIVENYLHNEVCQNRLTLEEAQKLIVNDWYKVYLEIKRRKTNGKT